MSQNPLTPQDIFSPLEPDRDILSRTPGGFGFPQNVSPANEVDFPVSFMRALQANLIHNPLVAFARSPEGVLSSLPDEFQEPDPDFDPDEHILPGVPYTDRSLKLLHSADNLIEFQDLHSRILESINNRDIINETGFFANLGANLFLAPLDPISYIPVGGLAIKGGRTGAIAGKAALSSQAKRFARTRAIASTVAKPFNPQALAQTARLTVPPLVLSEGSLQLLDPQREAEETVMNAAAAFGFTRLLVGSANTLRGIKRSGRMRRARITRLGRRLADEAAESRGLKRVVNVDPDDPLSVGVKIVNEEGDVLAHAVKMVAEGDTIENLRKQIDRVDVLIQEQDELTRTLTSQKKELEKAKPSERSGPVKVAEGDTIEDLRKRIEHFEFLIEDREDMMRVFQSDIDADINVAESASKLKKKMVMRDRTIKELEKAKSQLKKLEDQISGIDDEKLSKLVGSLEDKLRRQKVLLLSAKKEVADHPGSARAADRLNKAKILIEDTKDNLAKAKKALANKRFGPDNFVQAVRQHAADQVADQIDKVEPRIVRGAGETLIERVKMSATKATKTLKGFIGEAVNLSHAKHIDYWVTGTLDPTDRGFGYARLDFDADGKLFVTFDLAKLRKGFEDQVWTRPAFEGVNAFPRDTFKKPDEWVAFVVEHEMLHSEKIRIPDKAQVHAKLDDAASENLINIQALNRAVGHVRLEDDLPFGAPASGYGPTQTSIVISNRALEQAIRAEHLRTGSLTEARKLLLDSYGFDRIAQLLNPVLQMATSNSMVLNRVIQKLNVTPFYYAANRLGFTNGPSVETRVKEYIGMYLVSLEKHNTHYRDWLKRKRAADNTGTFSSLKDALSNDSKREFNRLVGRTLRMGREADPGDESVLAAAKVWRTELYDPVLEKAVAVGLLTDKMVESVIKHSPSYYHRVYDKVLLRETREEFIDTLSTRMDREAAVNAYEHLMSTPDGTIKPGDVETRGGIRRRALEVPDALVERWLVDDVELVSANYAKIYGMDIELKRTFGDPSMKKTLANIKGDYNKLIRTWEDRAAKAGTSDQKARHKATAEALRQEMDKNLRKLELLRDRMRNMDDLPEDPSSLLSRAPAVVRNFAYMAHGGSFMLSNIPDMANAVALYGMNRVFKNAWSPYLANLKGLEMTKAEAHRLAIATEGIRGMVINDMIGTQSMFGRVMPKHPVDRGLMKLFGHVEHYSFRGAEAMNKLSLLSKWTDVVQMVNFMAAQDFILGGAERAVTGGKISPESLTKLSSLGLSRKQLRNIWTQFEKHGAVEGKSGEVRVLNTEKWFDTKEGAEAAAAVRGALSTSANLTNMVAGFGDRPLGSISTPLGQLGFTTPLGKMMTMYTSFGFAAITRVGMMRLQAKDQAAMSSTMMALGLGALVTHLKSLSSGSPGPQSTEEWAAESVDRSGILGWLINADMLLGIATNGKVGINAWSNHPNARFSAGAMLQTATGAGGSYLYDVGAAAYGIGRDAMGGDVGLSTVGRANRVLPYNNLFYLNGLMNLLDDGPREEIFDDGFNTR